MTALIAWFVAGRARLAERVAALGALALAALGAYRAVRLGGAQAQQLDTMKQGEQDRAKADQVVDSVVRMGDDAVARELRERFSRGS